MPARRLTIVLPVLAVVLVGQPARAATTADVARALAADPVYVEPGAEPTLSVDGAGRVRLRILDRALGRIKVAVLAPRAVARLGGLARVANALDRELRPRGALIATAGGRYHVVTSHPAAGAAAAAVRRGVRRQRGLVDQLVAAVDGVAAADPGPEADLDAGPTVASPTGGADGSLDGLFDAMRLGVLLVAVAAALPPLLIVLLLVLRVRRGRAHAAERRAAERERARDELVALGDAIRELDLDVTLADPRAAGRAEYEQALLAYDRVNGFLAVEEPSELTVAESLRLLAEAGARIDAIRTRLG